MPLRSYSDVPNRTVRLFLQEAGRRYDENRGLKPYSKLTPDLLARFDNRCAYCGVLKPLVEEHIVPINRLACGLHAWGNVVPACGTCNKDKKDLDWRTHADGLATSRQATANRRVGAIAAYIDEYAYQPDIAHLREVVGKLYALADAQTRGLIEFGLVASQPFIAATQHGGPHPIQIGG